MPLTPGTRSVALRRVSTVEALTDAVREQILAGELPTGSALREVDLCDVFGVSRHTVRTALQALAHEGLVEIVANRGAFVAAPEAADVVDLFGLRSVLELTAVEQLAKAGAGRLEPVRRTVEALAALPTDADWSVTRDADLAFHQALVDSLASERISKIYASLLMELRLCMLQIRDEFEDPVDVARQHAEILDAVAARKGRAAARLLREHLDESCEHVVAARARRDEA